MSSFKPRAKIRRKKTTALGFVLAPMRRVGQAVRAILMRPILMLMIGLAGFILFVGTPHVAWDYQCSHSTRGGGFCQSANWCAYYGFQGRRVVAPPTGEPCSLITFQPIDWQAVFEKLRSQDDG